MLPHDRHRERRQHDTAPHLLRDARQLLDRRLLQGGRVRVRAGSCPPRGSASARKTSGSRCSRATRSSASAPTRRRSRPGASVGVPRERIVLLPALGELLAGRARPARAARAASSTSTAAWSGAPRTTCPGGDNERFLEYWNLVFMQYDQDPIGTLTPLPAKNIDTGLGLNRMALIQQGVADDLRDRPVRAAHGARPRAGRAGDDRRARAADPRRPLARGMTFLIADGVVPSNEDRGYVLRRVMRRAIQQGHRIGIERPGLPARVRRRRDRARWAAPTRSCARAATTIQQVGRGPRRRASAARSSRARGCSTRSWLKARREGIGAEDAFRLHDTYGFPIELTREIAAERGVPFGGDEPSSTRLMDEQRARSSAGANGPRRRRAPTSCARSRAEPTRVHRLRAPRAAHDGRRPCSSATGARWSSSPSRRSTRRAAARSPTSGAIECEDGDCRARSPTSCARATTRRSSSRPVEGELKPGERVVARVDPAARHATAANHTATHLLHAALRERLGTHVHQAGSYVGPDKLRFDFTHGHAPDRRGAARRRGPGQRLDRCATTPCARSRRRSTRPSALGAMALFGEKYGDVVRMVEIGDGSYSRELCGGTHVRSTAEIGVFKILVGGLQRVQRAAHRGGHRPRGGRAAARATTRCSREVGGRAARVPAERALDAVADAAARRSRRRRRRAPAERRGRRRRAGRARRRRSTARACSPRSSRRRTPRRCSTLADRVKGKLGDTAAIVLGTAADGRVHLVAAVAPALVERGVKAGEIVKAAAQVAGGGGGGRDTMAQAGGRDPGQAPRGDRRRAGGDRGRARLGVAPRRPSGAASLVRVLALDYGSARCGCALSDPTGTLATPIDPSSGPPPARGFARLAELVREREVERVVVGLPLSLSRRATPTQTRETRAFAERLADAVAVPVELYDERFTTAIAARSGGDRARARTRAPPRCCSRTGSRATPARRTAVTRRSFGARRRRRSRERERAAEREAARLERERRRAAARGGRAERASASPSARGGRAERARRRPSRARRAEPTRDRREPEPSRPPPAAARARPPTPSRAGPTPSPCPTPARAERGTGRAAARPPRLAARGAGAPPARRRLRAAAAREPADADRRARAARRGPAGHAAARAGSDAAPAAHGPLPRPQTEPTSTRPIGTGGADRRRARVAAAALPPSPAPRRPPSASSRRPPPRLRRIWPCSRCPRAWLVWFASCSSSPSTATGPGPSACSIPPGATAGEIGDLLAERGVVDSGFFFALRAASRRRARRAAARARYTPAQRHVLRRGARRADHAARRPPPVVNVTIPEGRRAARPRRCVARRRACKGSYLAATRRSRRARARATTAPRAARSTLEGFLFPATYELRSRGATAARLVDRAARRVPGRNFAQGRPAPRRGARTSRRYDVLMIASMIEREAQVAERPPAHRRGHLQPPQAGHAARHRRDAPLRAEQLDRARCASPSCSRDSRLQHAHAPGPAADADRQPGPGVAAGGGATRRTCPYLYYVVKPCGNGAHAFSVDRRAVPARRQRLQPRAGQAAAARSPSTLRRAMTPPRRPRLAGRPQPLAGDAQRGLAALGLAASRYQRLPVPPELFAETVARRCPPRASPGANVTIPHKEAALALADDAPPTRPARSARPTR